MQEIELEVSNFISSNNCISVNTNEDLTKATACIKGIKLMQNKVKESYNSIISQAHDAHKEAIFKRDKFLNPLLDIERKFKDAILVFNRKMEAEQQERIRLANAEMARVAEEKRQRLIQESKQTDDAWAKEELREKAQAVQAVVCDAPGKAIEQESLSIRKTWKARVIDINLVPREYLLVEANMSALHQHARTNKNLIQIPGVEFYEDQNVSVRS